MTASGSKRYLLDTSALLSASPEFVALQQRFVEIARVEGDWDSYGAARVDSRAIAVAQSLVVDVMRALPGRPISDILPFDVMPLPTGSVQVIWRGRGGTLDLDVSSQGQIG